MITLVLITYSNFCQMLNWFNIDLVGIDTKIVFPHKGDGIEPTEKEKNATMVFKKIIGSNYHGDITYIL